MNGLDNIDLSAKSFHLVGMGSTTSDNLCELVRRAVQEQGHNFKVSICFRTPRRYTTYLGTVVQPPSVYPFYYASPFSAAGHQIDKTLYTRLHQITGQYKRILDYMNNVYEPWEVKRQVEGKTTAWSA